MMNEGRMQDVTDLPDQLPPGMAGLGVVGQTLSFLRDPLRCLDRCASQPGDLVYLRVGIYPVVVPLTAALVQEVLVTRHKDFPKVEVSKREPAKVVFGNGLSLSEGDAWVRQRRLVQPAFSRRALEQYQERFLEHAVAVRDRWAPNTVQPIDDHMMEVSLHIAVDTLLGSSIAGDVDRVRHLIRICLSNISALNSLIENVLPAQIPTPRRSRFARAVAELDAIIFDIIARRRSDPGGQDLLSLLIQVADTEDGSMSDRQLRDEAMTMFVAGHETTAVTLSWACMLLGRHPESQRRLHAELDEVAGNRAITVEDLPKLRYAEQVIKEALRLYPPAYVYARQPRRDVELGGYRVPAKTLVMNSPWLMQRDPRLFANALEFRPERWEGDFERSLPNGAYIPFGLGGRRCVGQAFAISESVAVLVTLMQRYHLEPLDAETKSQVAMTLRPRRLNMRVLSRERQN